MSPYIVRLQRRIDEAQAAITAFQQECPHPDIHKKPGANTGGYDGPRFDEYWVDHTCKRCGKWWRAEK
jgi:hypothetical protein